MIRAVPLQIYGEKQDNLVWKGSQDGDFHLASAYKLARLETTDVQTFHGNWIWKLDTLPKIKHFLWLCCHNSVPVKKVLESRGIIHDACCPLCRNHEETILHTLRDCPVAMNFWQKFGTPQSMSSFMHLSLADWLSTNCLDSKLNQINGIPWSIKIVFPLAVWNLWKHRNNMVFQNSPININLHSLCMKAATEYFYCVGKGQAFKRHFVIPVYWCKPQEGWFTLNSDGASLGNPRKAGGEGLIHDFHGKWIKGFMRYIGISTSIIAEFWALRDGLTLASQLGITHLAVELDAKVIGDLVLSRKTSNNSYTSLLNDCRYFLGQFQQTTVKHVFREANRGADSLAKGACSLTSDFVVLDVPPTPNLNVIVNSDANGLYS
ncbi:putative ribonuclease H protein At1g65750 isoform X3 [Castanea sativa]